ncbi:outer membrane beta-barrel protein [Colwelliaceae bacterium BS250]
MKFCRKSTVVFIAFLQFFAITYSYAIEPHNFKLQGFEFTPQIKATQRYSDNFANSNISDEGSWLTTISPSFELSKNYNLNRIQFNYQITNVNYWSSQDDDYTNHKLSALTFLDLDVRHRLNISADYLNEYEERGTGYSIGFAEILKEPTASETLQSQIRYNYGAKTAQGNVELRYSFEQIKWDSLFIDELNLPQTGTDLDFTANREYKQHKIGTTFFYKTGAYTKISFSVDTSEVEYQHPRPNEELLDSTLTSAFVGVEWQGSALTTGYVRLGYSSKEFDYSLYEDTDGFRWQVGILWTPLTYSNFDFSTSKSVSEAKGQGSSIENTDYHLSWQHQWLDRIATKLTAGYSEDDYGDSERYDDNTSYSATIYYKMLRNLDISATVANSDRKSNINTVEYQENIIEFGISASF